MPRPTKRGLPALLFVTVCLLFAPAAGRAEDPSQLKQQGYVNDFAGFIGENESGRIGDVCRKLDEETSDRILVVTVSSTGALTPGQLGERLRNSWIGVSDVRERTLLIVVNGEGRIGFGIGSSLESILTHEKLDAALAGSRTVGGNDYGQKLLFLVQRIAEDIKTASNQSGASSAPAQAQPPASPPPASSAPSWTEGPNRRPYILFCVFLVLSYLHTAFRVLRRPMPLSRKILGLVTPLPVLYVFFNPVLLGQLNQWMHRWFNQIFMATIGIVLLTLLFNILRGRGIGGRR